MSPLHVNAGETSHTGRPRGEITTATSVTNSARPLPKPRGLASALTKLKEMLGTYLGFVGPGIMISIAYMVHLSSGYGTMMLMSGSGELFHGCCCWSTIRV